MESQQKNIPTAKQILALKKLAHHLKPVVQVGKLGLSPSLLEELDQNLNAHELIKIAFLPKQKDAMDELLDQICKELQAVLITTIGNSSVIFRANPNDSILSELGE